jgi:PAS domain S-box-containing protein
MLHRIEPGRLIVELEPADALDHATTDADADADADAVGLPTERLIERVSAAIERFGHAASIGVLADAVVQVYRELIGYDRVMVYKFDADGHGKIIAEARDPRLPTLLGHHYPSTDIPQRARQLYLRNRVRVLADVHYAPSPLQPPRPDDGGGELDMSMCQLRSMSPLHLQYLKNMGVTATAVVSLVREGTLWGLVAAHHDSPRRLRAPLRTACDLLAEVVSTRIAAIENYAHAQVAVMVRRLEQRLIEATSTEGDWKLALFRNPRTLLQPLEATGAALFVEGEILSTGEVPSTPELRQLLEWVHAQPVDPLFSCASVGKAHPPLESLTPTASGVLAVRLSTARPDYLMWFRKEQLLSVTWAGDPAKPTVANNPLELSPRSSFAAWSEIVRGTALPWTGADLALGRAIGLALVDIIVQVHAVRLLIAEHQLGGIRATVQSTAEPVLITDAGGRVLFVNAAFATLIGRPAQALQHIDDLAADCQPPGRLHQALAGVQGARSPWRGELALQRPDGEALPVELRAELVPTRDGLVLGVILRLTDLRHRHRAAEARRHLEESMQLTWERHSPRGPADALGRAGDEVIGAIHTNASLAAMDIAEGAVGTPVAQLLEELEASTRRAAALYERIRGPGNGSAS